MKQDNAMTKDGKTNVKTSEELELDNLNSGLITLRARKTELENLIRMEREKGEDGNPQKYELELNSVNQQITQLQMRIASRNMNKSTGI